MNGLNWNEHQEAVDATMADLTKAVEQHRHAGINYSDATNKVACEWGWTLQDVRLHYSPSQAFAQATRVLDDVERGF